MIDLQLLRERIDAFCLSQPEEEYLVKIPAEKGGPRKYLGLSMLGDECKRKVFYTWRHVAEIKFPARLYRLFRRGHREEAALIFLLRGAGLSIHETDDQGEQFSVNDAEGHISGHLDGVGEAPQEYWGKKKPFPFLTEYKTYNAKRFGELTKRSVKISDPKYYGQCQAYMGLERLKGCLFCAVCKDTDELHFEWLKFNEEYFLNLMETGIEIVNAKTPPAKLSSMGSDWRCKYCDFAGICHRGEPAVKSCRSCKFAEPGPAKSWVCTKGGTYGTLCKKYQDITKLSRYK